MAPELNSTQHLNSTQELNSTQLNSTQQLNQLNCLTRVDYVQEGTADVFVYDAYGDLRDASTPDVAYSYTYDDLHRMKTKNDSRFPGKALTYTYDFVGNRIEKVGYEGDLTRYQYDGADRLVAQANEEFVQVSYHYDPAGRLLDRILSNGSRTRYAYDPGNRLVGLRQTTASGTVLDDVVFGHDRVGNITSRTAGAVEAGYTNSGSRRGRVHLRPPLSATSGE